MSVYLDWNATTPPHASVLEAMQLAHASAWGNASSVHAAGRRARDKVEGVREALGQLFKLSPRDVVFTSGGTEANHLALSGAQVLVTSRQEHPSLVLEAERLAALGAKVVFAKSDASGTISPAAVIEALEEALGDGRGAQLDPTSGGLSNQLVPLVALSAINHETGVIMPVLAIADAVHLRGGRLHVDAVQLLGRGALDILSSADSVAISAHKIRGPQGVGALAFACGWNPIARGLGGAQERGLRAGTHDVAGIAGFGAAIGRLQESVSHYQALAPLRAKIERELVAHGALIHGVEANRAAHVINFRVPGWRGDELVAALDLAGICVSSGSACSAGTAEPSPVIQDAFGADAAEGAVRVSLGEETSQEHIDAFLRGMRQVGALAQKRS